MGHYATRSKPPSLRQGQVALRREVRDGSPKLPLLCDPFQTSLIVIGSVYVKEGGLGRVTDTPS